MLDLNKLETKLNEALEEETVENLKLWMNMNRIIKEFDPQIYPYKLWVIIDKTPDEIPALFYGYDGKEIENIVSSIDKMEAFTMPVMKKDFSSYGVIVFFRSKKQMNVQVIAHEASHAAKFLFEHIGAEIKEHEPFEYVVGWVAECCDLVRKGKI
ncbi:hypothetical protein [Bacteroides heparinolyticus]|uniref:hypothetical protein n=1 Tax=Prevotella heparinolytica TaxID=28113 RepID=UPI0028E2262F|nr:hypothetical protein [Bacteroides heparinolyticus]